MSLTRLLVFAVLGFSARPGYAAPVVFTFEAESFTVSVFAQRDSDGMITSIDAVDAAALILPVTHDDCDCCDLSPKQGPARARRAFVTLSLTSLREKSVPGAPLEKFALPRSHRLGRHR